MSKEIRKLKRKFTTVFNKYIRLRDSKILGDIRIGQCISCGKFIGFNSGNWNAGHYYSVGAYPSLRFDEENVNGQCVSCNKWKEGNKQGYTEGLVKKYGPDIIEKLSFKKNYKSKLGEGDYRFLIQFYQKKINKLEGI